MPRSHIELVLLVRSLPLGPACLRGKWERKENREGKWGKGKHFPLLVRRENGRGKKMRKENSVGPMPHSPPQLFPPKMGGFWDKFLVPTCCPSSYQCFLTPLFLSSPLPSSFPPPPSSSTIPSFHNVLINFCSSLFLLACYLLCSLFVPGNLLS